MKSLKEFVIAGIYLLIAITVIIVALPNAIPSLALLNPGKPGRYSPVLGDTGVQADLIFLPEETESATHTTPFGLSLDERVSSSESLSSYMPNLSDEDIELDIPEGCNISTNLASELNLFELINKDREERGLALLTWNDELSNAARKHSIDMACNNFFSHVNPAGESFEDRIAAEGYDYFAVGENIYAGDEMWNSSYRAFRAWLYSAAHFSVMTHTALTEIGIGYVYNPDSRYGGYFTADFASPE